LQGKNSIALRYAVKQMIRRQDGKHLLLIRQDDHARVAGELARRVGNALFAPPSPFDSVILGISHHDCGWQPEDSKPQLNVHGHPEHVFEADILTALDAWAQSVDQVISRDPYAGMLVSLHTMALANRAAAHEVEHQDEVSRQKTFRIRRFVHRQIEIQEQLRGKLQMRTDQPLRGGLAEPGRSPEEDLLRSNFFLLELLDQVSLNLCFNEPIFRRIEMVYPRPGLDAISARISPDGEGGMQLYPWPFNSPTIEVDVPARRVPPGPYRDTQALHAACKAAAESVVRVVLRPSGS
jgi:hypothetical protein